MKAILVINNIHEDFDYRKCSIGGDGNIYYERKGEQRTSIIGNIKNLKPMPEKLPEVYYESRWFGWNKILDCVIEDLTKVKDFSKGWNACIDEILGEEE